MAFFNVGLRDFPNMSGDRPAMAKTDPQSGRSGHPKTFQCTFCQFSLFQTATNLTTVAQAPHNKCESIGQSNVPGNHSFKH
jgi:hypothetical protein